MNDIQGPDLYKTIHWAFESALPPRSSLKTLSVRLSVLDVNEDWRQDVVETLTGASVTNQGQTIKSSAVIVWNGLNFRSHSEVVIAEALEKAGVMFFPNCRARLGIQKRGRMEPDFLICHKGKWGILEVDGEPWHPPTRTTQDHARDAGFLNHGVKLVRHVDATECRTNPDKVVAEFLAMLEKVTAL